MEVRSNKTPGVGVGTDSELFHYISPHFSRGCCQGTGGREERQGVYLRRCSKLYYGQLTPTYRMCGKNDKMFLSKKIYIRDVSFQIFF